MHAATSNGCTDVRLRARSHAASHGLRAARTRLRNRRSLTTISRRITRGGWGFAPERESSGGSRRTDACAGASRVLAAWRVHSMSSMYSKARIAGHPLHPMMVVFPIALYTASVAALLAFVGTADAFYYRA